MDAPAAPAAAGAAPSLTFAWLGDPSPDAGGLLLYYQSFQFCATTYAVGDHVYLTPEDQGAPLYLARITAAFEDTQQQGGDRLCVEVRRHALARTAAAMPCDGWLSELLHLATLARQQTSERATAVVASQMCSHGHANEPCGMRQCCAAAIQQLSCQARGKA
jgi:hypothetical protein